MSKQKRQQEKAGDTLLDILTPIMGYLLKIEHDILSDDKSYLKYVLGVPNTWILKSSDLEFNILKRTDNIQIVEVWPYNTDMDINQTYSAILDIINKNNRIDEIRNEYEREMNNLKNKFESEQKKMLENLFKEEDYYEDNMNENEEEGEFN